jgi:hypothetical protein
MSYEKQVEVIDKLQQLAISIETTQRKLIKYEVSEIERNRLQQQLEKMLVVMNRFFIEEAHAEDYAKTCIFAGWLADYTKKGKAVYCNISAIKAKSGNYKTNYLTEKEKAPLNKCTDPDQVPCQPLLFGTDNNGKYFCVNRSSAGTNYTNASANCRDLSKKANNYGEIIKNIIKNPKDFLELLRAIQKLCLCDVDGAQNTNEYRRVIMKDGTCRSLIQQLKNLFANVDIAKLELTCSAEAQELSTGLKEVMPVVNAFDMEKKFLDERSRICNGNPPVIVIPGPTVTVTPTVVPEPVPPVVTVTPTVTPVVTVTVTPTVTPVVTVTVTPTVTPTKTPDDNVAIAIALGAPTYSATNSAEVKITSVTCPGLTKVEDIGVAKTECLISWFTKDKDSEVKPEVKNETKITPPQGEPSQDEEDEGDVAEQNDFGEESDSKGSSLNLSLKDKEQLVTVVLTYKGKTASSDQTIKKLEKTTETPTPTPTATASPTPSPTPEADEESDPPIPPQQQPQIPFGMPLQPMLLPGVL